MKKLCVSKTDKKLCGVCGGVAEYLGIDSTVVRIAAVLLSMVAGGGVLMYILCALIMPKAPEETFQSFYQEQQEPDHQQNRYS